MIRVGECYEVTEWDDSVFIVRVLHVDLVKVVIEYDDGLQHRVYKEYLEKKMKGRLIASS